MGRGAGERSLSPDLVRVDPTNWQLHKGKGGDIRTMISFCFVFLWILLHQRSLARSIAINFLVQALHNLGKCLPADRW